MSVLFRVEIGGLPPTVNHFYRTSRQNRRYKTEQARQWQGVVSMLMRRAYGRKEPIEEYVSLHIVMVSKNKRRWDVDNRIKPLQDCLEFSGILKNDTLIMDLHARRRFGKEDSTIIEVRRLEGVEHDGDS